MRILPLNSQYKSNQNHQFGAFYVPGALKERFFYRTRTMLTSVAEAFPDFAARYEGPRNLRNIVLTAEETNAAKLKEAAMQDTSIGISSSARDSFIKSCIEKLKMANLKDLEQEFNAVA